MDKRNQNSIRNDSIAFKTNNVGVNHLTGSLSFIKRPKEERNHLLSELSLKLNENNVKNYIMKQNNIDGELPYIMKGDSRGIAELRKEIK